MYCTARPGRINVKVVVILLLAAILLMAGAAVGYKVRKRIMANRALEAGQAALEKQDWSEACKQLRTYLSKYTDDLEVMAQFADANLQVRPLEPGHIGAAVGAYRQLLRSKPGDAEICRKLAVLYSGIGNHTEAAYVCRQRLEKDPTDAMAQFRLAKALAAQRKHAEAMEVLQELVAAHPDNVKAYGLLSTLAAQADSVGSIESARSWLDQAVEAAPQSAEALAQRARFQRIFARDSAGAEQDLRAAAALQPEDPSVILTLAEEWMTWGNLEQADSVLQQAEQIDRAKLDEFEIDPDAFALTRFLIAGRLALRQGASERGAAVADQALEQLPQHRRRTFLPAAVDLYLADGRIDDARQALEDYRQASQTQRGISPAVSDAIALLEATIAQAEGKPYRVIDLLDDLIVRRPDSKQTVQLLWEACRQTGQPGRAAKHLEEYVTRQPGDADAMLELARSYRSRDWVKTLKYAAQAERAGESDATSLRIEAILHGGSGPLTKLMIAQLEAELASLQKSRPADATIPMLLAFLHVGQGQHDKAITELEQALATCDDPLPAAMQLAKIHADRGQTDQAVEVCQAAIARWPDAGAPRMILAEMLSKAGRAPEARAALDEAVQALTGDQQASAQLTLAQYMLSQGERQEAIELLDRAAADRSEDAGPRLVLLSLPEVSRDAPKAQKLIDELKTIEGEGGLRWRVEQARLWLRDKDWESRRQNIEEMLTRCIEADPAWAAPVVVLGDVYEMVGQDEQAEETYRRMLSSGLAEVTVTNALLQLLHRQGRMSEANEVLDRLPERLSGTPLMSTYRAGTAFETGDYAGAIEELQELASADPNAALTRVLLAKLVYIHEKDAERAFRLLDEAAAVAPDLAAVTSTRAAILNQEGRGNDAVQRLNAEVDRRGDFTAYRMRAEYYVTTGQPDLAEQDLIHLTKLPDSAADGYAALGEFYLQTGRTNEAIDAWRAGLAETPQHRNLRRMLATVLLADPDEGKRSEGWNVLQSLLADFPDDARARLVQAKALLNEHTADAAQQAEGILEQLVEKDARNIEAHLLLVRVAQQEADPDKAEARLTRALGANAQDTRLRLLRAGMEAAAGRTPAARELAQAVLNSDPDSVGARNVIAELALLSGDTTTAREFNDQALALNQADETAQMLHARILDAEGRRGEAVKALTAYSETAAGSVSVPVKTALAMLCTTQGDFTTATDLLDQAEKLAPGDADVFTARLKWLATQDKFAEISAALNQWRTDHPQQSAVLLAGGWLLASSGTDDHMRTAKTLFEQVLTQQANNAEAQFGLAQVAYRLGDLDTAVQVYRKLLELEPYHRQALNELAWILGVEQGNPQEGLVLADRAAARYPDDPHVLDTRGVLLTALDRLAEARQDLEHCVENTGELPATRARALLHLARVCISQQQREQAGRRLAEAQAIDQDKNVLTTAERAELQELLQAASQPAAQTGGPQ